MHTRSDHHSPGRGAHLTWFSALGLVLVAGGLMLSQAAGLAMFATGHPDRPAARAELTGSDPATAPFVVEPQVRFEEATPPGPPRTAAPRPRPAAAAGVPVRLVVPELGVDAPVVGIAASGGVLLPPSDPRTLGWWSAGAVPGAVRGGALVTGHTVHTGGGAFDDLETLEAGDRVRVRTAAGVLRYVVRGVTIYRKASLAEDAQKVFSQVVPGRLVLVTCEDWDGRTYRSNAVVFADLLPDR